MAAQIKGRCVDNAPAVCAATRGEKQIGRSGWSACDGGREQLNIASSRETDRENGYENRLPAFSYERSPNDDICNLMINSVICNKDAQTRKHRVTHTHTYVCFVLNGDVAG